MLGSVYSYVNDMIIHYKVKGQSPGPGTKVY